MSHIEGLISHHCPDGVEFIALQELFNTRNGYTPSRKNPAYWENGTIPWFRLADIRGGDRILTEAIENVSPSAVKKSGLFPAGTIIISTLATIGEHALMEVPGLCNQQLTALTLREKYADLFNIKFLFYYTFLLADWCKKNTMNSSFASVDMKQLKRFKFPVPPLEVQDEIVRVLDSFTNLEANLQTELEARRQQYEYYRDSLLSLESLSNKLRDEVKIIPLGNICKIARGASPRPIRSFLSQDSLDSIPWIKIGDIDPAGKYVTKTNQYIKPSGVEKSREIFPGDFLLSNSMSFGRPYISKIYGCIHDGWLKLSDFEETFLPDYLYHLLRSSQVQLQFQASVGSGTVSNLNSLAVSKVMVPVPPLAEQERIVAILDKFDALVNDLSSGLPAEIAARRKQYEYYRDQLLSFTPAK